MYSLFSLIIVPCQCIMAFMQWLVITSLSEVIEHVQDIIWYDSSVNMHTPWKRSFSLMCMI